MYDALIARSNCNTCAFTLGQKCNITLVGSFIQLTRAGNLGPGSSVPLPHYVIVRQVFEFTQPALSVTLHYNFGSEL
jgi:hypothetical protein